MLRVAPMILAVALLVAACGPVESTSIRWQVESTIRRAENLGAQRTAPYELTSARQYLHKGKEEAGYAQYEAAIDYFHKAKQNAKAAVERAEAASKMRGTEEPAAPPEPRPAEPAKKKGR